MIQTEEQKWRVCTTDTQIQYIRKTYIYTYIMVYLNDTVGGIHHHCATVAPGATFWTCVYQQELLWFVLMLSPCHGWFLALVFQTTVS